MHLTIPEWPKNGVGNLAGSAFKLDSVLFQDLSVYCLDILVGSQ